MIRSRDSRLSALIGFQGFQNLRKLAQKLAMTLATHDPGVMATPHVVIN